VAHEFAIYEKRGHIAYVTINRPERLNALHPPANLELNGIWDDVAADPDVWVAILTGAGDRAFSAGNDLKYTAEHAGTSFATGPFIRGGFGGITNRYDLFKPVIGAVNGWAMGGGFEMALACDILIAADTAQFGLPEPRVGLVAGAGGMHRLPRQLPEKIALGMLLTGKPIDAARAAHFGLVNEVVARDQLMAAAERWANEIMECAPLAVRGSKEAAKVGLDLPLEAAIRRGYDNVARHMASADRLEGPRAFAEKRPPRWSGT
jgi:enoyl-CoA hydratase/carnithine racemase